MDTFDAKPRQWGNSLGVIIPKELVDKEHISEKKDVTVLIISKINQDRLQKAFGSLHCAKPTQQIMDEIDEGYD